MELKLIHDDGVLGKIYVWIAPLWNWNFAKEQDQANETSLNRTFMELKLMIQQVAETHEKKFESHLYGIETRMVAAQLTASVRLNRTFMELKLCKLSPNKLANMFESHLYGIETCYHRQQNLSQRWFESHLYGIETRRL